MVRRGLEGYSKEFRRGFEGNKGKSGCFQVARAASRQRRPRVSAGIRRCWSGRCSHKLGKKQFIAARDRKDCKRRSYAGLCFHPTGELKNAVSHGIALHVGFEFFAPLRGYFNCRFSGQGSEKERFCQGEWRTVFRSCSALRAASSASPFSPACRKAIASLE